MHGLGNDFVVFDAINQTVQLSAEQVRFLAHRRFGVGCDQVLLVEPAQDSETEFYYRIFNADGSEVEQCGNGARCFARFVREKGLSQSDVIDVGTARGNIRLYLEEGDQVRVNMGAPELEPALIPFSVDSRAASYTINVDEHELSISAVSMGNPHAVLITDDIDTTDVAHLGPLIESHPLFPDRVNAGFMSIVDRQQIRLRVYERGTGETLACGTGACAAVVAGRLLDLLDEKVKVQLPGGELVVSWDKNGAPVWMTGPATLVFDGNITL